MKLEKVGLNFSSFNAYAGKNHRKKLLWSVLDPDEMCLTSSF